MVNTRVLVACHLTSYREALAGVFRELRPNVEVFETEMEDLDSEVGRLGPDLVVCNRVTARVENDVPNWVELYPFCEARSVVNLRGERTTIEEIQLSDLLSVIDRAERPAYPV